MKTKHNLAILFLLLISTVIATIYFRNSLSSLFDTQLGGGYYYSHQFDSQERWVNTQNKNEIGLKEDISLEGIRYEFKKNVDDRVVIKVLWGRPYEQITEDYRWLSSIELVDAKQGNAPLAITKKIGSVTKDLSGYTKGNQTLAFFLKRPSKDKNNIQDGDVLIRRIEVSVSAKNFILDLPLYLMMVLFPVFFYYFFSTILIPEPRAILAALIILPLEYLCFFFYPQQFLNYSFMVLAILIIVMFLFLKYNSRDNKIIITFVFLIVLLCGIEARWSELKRVAFAIPFPDAAHRAVPGYRSYREKADKMMLFTSDNGFYAVKDHHEPFFPFVAKVFFAVFGSSDLHLRFVSLFFSILAIYLSYLVGKEIFGGMTTLLSVTALTFNQFLIEQSVLGVRTELETCFLLLLFYVCYLKRELFKTWMWVIINSLISALWILTRTLNAPIVLFIILFSAFNRKLVFRKKILLSISTLCIAVLPIIPYKYNMYRIYNDPFWDSNLYATDAANIEFVGQPGFPKHKVTTKEYFFKLHNMPQLIEYHLIGVAGIINCLSQASFNIINEENHLIKIYLKDKADISKKYPGLSLKVAGLLFLAGCSIVLALLQNKHRIILYLILLGTLHNAFAYGVVVARGTLIVTFYRQIAHVLPFFIFLVSYCLIAILGLFYKKNKLKAESV